MLLQLSASIGINTDTITDWAVLNGKIYVFFGSEERRIELDLDEGQRFLSYVFDTSDNVPFIRNDARARLRGTDAEQDAR